MNNNLCLVIFRNFFGASSIRVDEVLFEFEDKNQFQEVKAFSTVFPGNVMLPDVINAL